MAKTVVVVIAPIDTSLAGMALHAAIAMFVLTSLLWVTVRFTPTLRISRFDHFFSGIAVGAIIALVTLVYTSISLDPSAAIKQWKRVMGPLRDGESIGVENVGEGGHEGLIDGEDDQKGENNCSGRNIGMSKSKSVYPPPYRSEFPFSRPSTGMLIHMRSMV